MTNEVEAYREKIEAEVEAARNAPGFKEQAEDLKYAPNPYNQPESMVNALSIVFENKDACQRYINRCVVRWPWAIRLVNDGNEDKPEWRAVARRLGGAIHYTEHPRYVKESGDTALDPYVVIVKHADDKFTITNKFGA